MGYSAVAISRVNTPCVLSATFSTFVEVIEMTNARHSSIKKFSESVSRESQWDHETKPSVLVFDVNETLIDFSVLEPLFAEKFGDKRVMREWLGHLIMYSMTTTLSGLYVDYFTLGQGLLRMVGDIPGINLSESDAAKIGKGIQNMPAHGRRSWP
jgi:hypothetical protein